MWLPAVREEVIQVACPALKAALLHPEMALPPSLNVTVPVGAPVAEVTLAVKVTLCPRLDGLAEDMTVIAEATCCAFTVSVNPQFLFGGVDDYPSARTPKRA